MQFFIPFTLFSLFSPFTRGCGLLIPPFTKGGLGGIFIGILLGFVSTILSAQTVLKGARIATSEGQTRIVWDASQAPTYKVSILKNPTRVVIEFKNSTLQKNFQKPSLAHSGIRKWTAESRAKDLKVTLELDKAVTMKHFRLPTDKKRGHRVVIDLNKIRPAVKSIPAPTPTLVPIDVTVSAQNENSIEKVETPRPVSKHQKRTRPFVIILDPGHGGHDSGAVGRKGTYEKNVVLAIAKKLESLIQKDPNLKAVMVRKGDHYVGLRQRQLFARQHRADLFISIHADSYPNSQAYGASVYILSHKGATSEAAKFLADRENRSDLIGGLRLQDKDEMLASVLLDLSQSANTQASFHFAQTLLHELHQVVPLHKKQVERAGFMVLKSIDIPSVLVETGFISHPQGEAHLKSQSYQWDIAYALMKGIQEYVYHHPQAAAAM